MDHKLRVATNADMPFVYKAWLQVLRSAPSAKYIDDRTFFREHASLITSILASEGVRVTLACDPAEELHLYGFVCHSTRSAVVHWLYVVSTFRGLGLGRALLDAAVWPAIVGDVPITCTHACGPLAFVPLRKTLKLTYNPYLLRGL